MATRRSICLGSFQYRRTSSAPKPPDEPRHNLPPTKPLRKKPSSRIIRRPQIDLSLPISQQLACLIEHGLKKEFEKHLADASIEEREEFQTSANAILDCLRNDTKTEKAYAPNPVNKTLSEREAQLKIIVASYEKELKQWEHIRGVAEQESKLSIDLPESAPLVTPPIIAEVENVLAVSTRAVESYILQTDHFRSSLKRIESRNRSNQVRVTELAASLNDRVMAEFGNDETRDLLPPQALVNVHTNELNVAVLTGDC